MPSAKEVAWLKNNAEEEKGQEKEKGEGLNELLVCLVQARGLTVMDRAVMYVSYIPFLVFSHCITFISLSERYSNLEPATLTLIP